MTLDRWQALDLSCEPTPPDDLVPRVLTRGWITLFSGPPGAGKSYGVASLIAGALAGSAWLSMPVRGISRVLVVDEENAPDLVRQRLRALGVDPEQAAERLRYFCQLGCRLGEERWADDLLTIAADFGPDVVVIDSASSATAVQVSENDSIAAAFSKVLRPLARTGCAVLLLHHDRKASGELAERVLGGVQWLGQVDRSIAFEAQQRRPDTWTTPAGTVRASFPIRLIAGKSRQGVGIPDTLAAVESEQALDGSYRSIAFEPKGIEEDAGDAFAERVLALLAAGAEPMRRKAIAEAMGMRSTDGRLQRALGLLLRRGAIAKVERGVYRSV